MSVSESTCERVGEVRRRSILDRQPVWWLLAGLMISATVAAGADEQTAPAPHAEMPNLVILLADDLGYGELGCQGNPQIPTPHIDSIARRGVRFTDGYVTAPFCAASRAGLMTGRYQTRFGFELNPIGAKNEQPGIGLPASELTLAELLQDRGYATGLLGKWHLGGTADFHPFRHGFDEFFGFLHEGHYFVPPPYRSVTTMLRRRTLPGGGKGRWISRDGRTVLTTHMGYNEPDYDADNPIYRGGQPVEETEYLTDALTREAVDFIERHQERPFFLMLAYNAVHSPLQGSDRYMQRFEHLEDIHRRIFAAMLSNLDDSVGEVLGKLEECQLSRRTLVVFLSDNGGPTRELTSSNAPLRGEKGMVYEGGLRVPFLMQWTGRIEAGQTFREPVTSLDLFSTAAQLTGGLPEDRVTRDGVDLLPLLNGDASAVDRDRVVFWRTGRRAALRMGKWKLVRQPVRGQPDGWQLFDLEQDLAESKDLSAVEPERLMELIESWQTLDRQMVPPLW